MAVARTTSTNRATPPRIRKSRPGPGGIETAGIRLPGAGRGSGTTATGRRAKLM
jgi:hypothetical protein